MTDRFASCDPDACTSSGELRATEVGTFHGGSIAGITARIRQGWFQALGVNALLISAPYRQIMGWVPGGDGQFRHYAYHGYYALDYTVMDPRFGTEEEFAEFVAVAHAAGLKVILDVVVNHPGYPDLETLAALDIAALRPGWRQATPQHYYEYLDRQSPALSRWWGGDWVRADLAGYPPGGEDAYTALLFGLPDFRTERTAPVGLPAFFGQLRTGAVALPGASVRDYLIAWLCSWIERYGIDGFRCDSAAHVDPGTWLQLKQAASLAYTRRHGADGDAFWMLAEVFDHGVERDHYYYVGFDSVINFELQRLLRQGTDLDGLYARYARRMAGGADGFVSYLSSHDTFVYPQDATYAAATALMLAPGGVAIFYGDESGRQPSDLPLTDAAQNARTNMNWGSVDHALLEHWRKLGRFRARHPAICGGVHRQLRAGPHVFSRVAADGGDRVIAAVAVTQPCPVDVTGVFETGDVLRDAYGGAVMTVVAGQVTLPVGPVVLMEKV